jgi:broad specificity phosphatase PhoE
MRVLLVRHGQSTNNELRSQSQALYVMNRTEDPDLSGKGIRESIELGRTLSELGVKIDGILTSAFLRSLRTAHFF